MNGTGLKTIRNAVLLCILHGILASLCVFSLSVRWASGTFGKVNLDGIFFTLNMPLEGTGGGFLDDYVKKALIPGLILYAVLLILFIIWIKKKRSPLNRRNAAFLTGVTLVWILAILLFGQARFDFLTFVTNQIKSSPFIEQEYADAGDVALTFPEKKRNLVWIFVESAETTNQDKASGGIFDENYTPEMTRIARENTSFSRSDLIEGAAVAPASGWTIAGLLAETAGLPLKLYMYEDGGSGLDNSMSQYRDFMPGITTLGDILQDNGYHNTFLCGSVLAYGGREKFFSQHGGFEKFD